jgi:hypothetical protein
MYNYTNSGQDNGGPWYREANTTKSLPSVMRVPTGGWRGTRGYGAIPSNTYPQPSVIEGYWAGLGVRGGTIDGFGLSTQAPAPTIVGLSAQVGGTDGGNDVTIYGSNFDTGTKVYFKLGNIQKPAVIANIKPTEVAIKSPSLSPGVYSITVTNASGNEATAANVFEVKKGADVWGGILDAIEELGPLGLDLYKKYTGEDAPAGAPPTGMTQQQMMAMFNAMQQQKKKAATPPWVWGAAAVGGVALIGVVWMMMRRKKRPAA